MKKFKTLIIKYDFDDVVIKDLREHYFVACVNWGFFLEKDYFGTKLNIIPMKYGTRVLSFDHNHLFIFFISFITSHVVLWHPILSTSKNVQISTVSEFDVVARFRETIPTVKSVSSFEI